MSSETTRPIERRARRKRSTTQGPGGPAVKGDMGIHPLLPLPWTPGTPSMLGGRPRFGAEAVSALPTTRACGRRVARTAGVADGCNGVGVRMGNAPDQAWVLVFAPKPPPAVHARAPSPLRGGPVPTGITPQESESHHRRRWRAHPHSPPPATDWERVDRSNQRLASARVCAMPSTFSRPDGGAGSNRAPTRRSAG
jgi:hypothetical protein